MNDDVSLAVVIERLEHIDKRLDRVLDDHETRLRRVEHWVYAIPPTFIIAIASIIAAIMRGT